MDELKVGDIICFPADAQFGSGVSFSRPPVSRKHVVVDAQLTGGSEREGYSGRPDGLLITVLPLDANEELHSRLHTPLQFYQADVAGGRLYSNSVGGVAHEGFRSVTITHTKVHNARGVKETIAYQLN